MTFRPHAAVPRTPLPVRQGFALALVLLAIVVIAALGAGLSVGAVQEMHAGRSTMAEAHAFALAEWGLGILDADRQRGALTTMPVGALADTTYHLSTTGESAAVRVLVTRLNDETFWVVSEGRYLPAARARPQAAAVARTNRVLRVAPLPLHPPAAIVVSDSIAVRGRFVVDGADRAPPEWSTCDSSESGDGGGIALPLAAGVTLPTPSRVSGSPPILRYPVTDDSLAFVRRGGALWKGLVAAAKVYAGGPVAPTLDSRGACDTGNPGNWGEPWASTPVHRSVARCQDYFPVVYAARDVTLDGGRGQGVLLVDGSLRAAGPFEWDGVIIVTGAIDAGPARFVVHGSVMARTGMLADSARAGVSASVTYSRCAIRRAMGGAGRLVPARERAWARLF